MTRFARAKGSKASNERREEEPTPWHIMRQQLADQLSGQESVKLERGKESVIGRSQSSDISVKEEEIWSQFEEPNEKINLKLSKNEIKHKEKGCITKEGKVKKKALKLKSDEADLECHSKIWEEKNEAKLNNNEIGYKDKLFITKEGKVKKKTLKVKSGKMKTKCSSIVLKESSLDVNYFKGEEDWNQIEEPKVKKKKMSKLSKSKINQKNKSFVVKDVKTNGLENRSDKSSLRMNYVSLEENSPTETLLKEEDGLSQFVEHKKKKKSNQGIERGSETCTIKRKIETKSPIVTDGKLCKMEKGTKREKTGGKHDKFAQQYNEQSNNNSKVKHNNTGFSNTDKYQYETCLNWRSGGRGQEAHTIHANGREIQVVRYDGFYIKNDDAIRLMKLRRRLKEEKVPFKKINEVMKLERRKAEKALAREKTNVCFHCRKFGHKFSDCPDIKDSEMSKSGMCFKCGSMEHTYFQCKVQQNEEFRYAVCFVCKEQGHISRQCPLNSQGQYPKGGSCHVCGDVTHLKKDCPKAVQQKKSSDPYTVDMIKSDELEEISGDVNFTKKSRVKTNKIVTF